MNWFLVIMGALAFTYGAGFAVTLLTSYLYHLRSLWLCDGGLEFAHFMDVFENPGTLFLDALQSWYRFFHLVLWDFKEQREIVAESKWSIFNS
jgi:hypothetical protein